MEKRAFILFTVMTILFSAAFCGGSCAAAEAGKEPAIRTILIWANGSDLENPYTGVVSKRLIQTMEEEIPDSVNIIVLTGGTMEGWYMELPLEGADSVRTDCNQVWKMRGGHDGQPGALVLLEKDGLPAQKTDGPAVTFGPKPYEHFLFTDTFVSAAVVRIADVVVTPGGNGAADTVTYVFDFGSFRSVKDGVEVVPGAT